MEHIAHQFQIDLRRSNITTRHQHIIRSQRAVAAIPRCAPLIAYQQPKGDKVACIKAYHLHFKRHVAIYTEHFVTHHQVMLPLKESDRGESTAQQIGAE